LAAFADWQLSASDLSEWLGPAAFVLSALLSAWVLADARRLRKSYLLAFALALLALLLPPVVLPLYLAARLFTRKETEAGAADETDTSDETKTSDEADAPGEADARARRPRLKRWAVPLAYALALLAAGAFFYARDYRSFEARLARARSANLRGRHERAVEEYRAALRLREDAHTRKLLGLELLEAGRRDEALVELRAAARAGEPDVPEVQAGGAEAR
jgi:tetratricopeptide (TPR) repeat protein